jgi:phosphoglycolate phosphatase-like HAD superfamily hydrolase
MGCLPMSVAEPIRIADAGRFESVRALIFDLDGTLIDSGRDLALSVNATLEHMGRPPLTHERIYGYVGKGASRLIEQALGAGARREQLSNQEARTRRHAGVAAGHRH